MANSMPSAQMTPIALTRVGEYVYTLGPSHGIVNPGADVSVKPYAPPQYAALVIMNFGI